MYYLQHFGRILLFKAKPQDLTYSSSLFMGVLLLFLFMIFLVGMSFPDKDLAKTFSLLGLIKEVIFLGCLYYLLKLKNKDNRFVQTATNFIAIAIVQTVLLKLILNITNESLLHTVIVAWFFLVNIHIMRHAFDVKKWAATGMYLLINVPANILAIIVLLQNQPKLLTVLQQTAN